MSIKIKVCGLREPENVSQVLSLEPDYLGFILVKESRRFISPANLEELLLNENVSSKAILVIRDISFEELKTYPLSRVKGVQLHGSMEVESPEYIRELKTLYPELLILKAIGVNSKDSFEICDLYNEWIDHFLFDTKIKTNLSDLSGGTGKSFNWELLNYYKGQRPYFLSGGLGPENISMLEDLRAQCPKLVGVDLNSKYELEPGLKNIELLKTTFKILRG